MLKSAFTIAFTTASVIGLTTIPAHSATFSLGDLLANFGTEEGSITVGDKKFSDFSCQISASGMARPGSCDSINVITYEDDPFGLRFQSGFAAMRDSSLEVLLDYNVEVLDPDFVISGARLAFNGAFVGQNAQTSVTETIENMNGDTIGKLNVSNPTSESAIPDLQDPALEANDQGISSELQKVRIKNQIDIIAEGNSRGFISFIDQRFEQRRVEVPESNAAAGLLLFGCFGLGAILRQQRQGKA
ncbi:MAG: hypothetical protein WA865_16940 [Spirulinaceae cyanobacterium]